MPAIAVRHEDLCGIVAQTPPGSESDPGSAQIQTF